MSGVQKSLCEFPESLVKRVANVLEWGVTTGPSHPAATFEKFAEQVLRVVAHEGHYRSEPLRDPPGAGWQE